MNSRRRVAMVTAFACGLAIACADRRVGLEEMAVEELPACIVLSGYGEWDDGSVYALVNEDGLTSTACMCMTDEEEYYLSWEDEQAFLDHEINAMGLAECKRVAALHEFDWDPCQEYFETGHWRPTLGFAMDDDAKWNRDGLTCESETDDGLGCTMSRDQPSPAWLVILVGLIGLRRRPVISL